MKVITIKQPYATLIAKGLKRYEFRTWKTNYRGEIYIHAGKGIDRSAMERYEKLGLQYPRGQVIAKATLKDCLVIDDAMKQKLKEENEYIYEGIVSDETWRGYGFLLEDIEEIEPISMNGKLSLWNYEGEKDESKSRS